MSSDAEYKHRQLIIKRRTLQDQICAAVDAGLTQADIDALEPKAKELDLDFTNIVETHRKSRIQSKHTTVTIGCASVRTAGVPGKSTS